MENQWEHIDDIANKLSELKEQLPAALATWQQTNGSKTTVGWMHAANPEVISTLFKALEDEQVRSEMWIKNCYLEQALKLSAQGEHKCAVSMIVPSSLSEKDAELYIRQITARDEEISALKAKLAKAELKPVVNSNPDDHRQ